MAVNTDNLVGDFIVNTKIILEENRRTLGIRKVYDEDVGVVDVTPSVAITTSGITLNRRTLGSTNARFEVDILGEIWYYHEKVTLDTKRNKVMRSAWDLCNVLQKNATLNDWLSSTQAYIRACTWAVRRQSNVLLASARIIMVARYQGRFTIT